MMILRLLVSTIVSGDQRKLLTMNPQDFANCSKHSDGVFSPANPSLHSTSTFSLNSPSQGLGVVVGGETRGEGGVELGGLGLAGLDGEVGHAVCVGGWLSCVRARACVQIPNEENRRLKKGCRRKTRHSGLIL